jgi:peptide/nickel transport system substrate-binding protein
VSLTLAAAVVLVAAGVVSARRVVAANPTKLDDAIAARAPRAATDALVKEQQAATFFGSLGLATPERAEASFAAPANESCRDFAAALDFAAANGVVTGVQYSAGDDGLLQTVYSFRNRRDASRFEEQILESGLADCSRATAPAVTDATAGIDLTELRGKDLDPYDADALFLATTGRLTITPASGSAPQATDFATFWLHDAQLVTRIAVRVPDVELYDTDAATGISTATADGIGALVDAGTVNLAVAAGLVVGSGVPASPLPWEARSPCDTRTNALVYDTLLTQRGDGGLRPGLAERWNVSEDGLTYTFTVADGLEWSDGQPIAADDIVFALQLSRANRAIAPEFETISEITAVDQRTVRVTFTRPEAASGLWALSGPAGVPAKPSASPSGLPSSASNTVYWWFGPGSAGAVELGGDAERVADAYRLQQVATGAGLAALQDHSVDIAAIAGSEVDDAKAAGFRVDTEPTGSGAALFFNYRANPVFNDLDIRRAMSLAIDREEIVEAALDGHGRAAGAPLGPGWDDTRPFGAPWFEYDPKVAKKLLEDAGYAFDEELGVYVFDGTAGPDTPAIVSRLQSGFDALGVNAAVRLAPASELGAALSSGTADIVVTSVLQAPSGFDTVRRAIAPTSNQARALGADAAFADSELAGLLEQAAATADLDERKKLYAEVQKVFAEELPYLYLYTGDNVVGWDPAYVRGRVRAPADPCGAWGLQGVSVR